MCNIQEGTIHMLTYAYTEKKSTTKNQNTSHTYLSRLFISTGKMYTTYVHAVFALSSVPRVHSLSMIFSYFLLLFFFALVYTYLNLFKFSLDGWRLNNLSAFFLFVHASWHSSFHQGLCSFWLLRRFSELLTQIGHAM